MAPRSHPSRPLLSRRWGSLAVVCLAVMVIVMDGSIVNVALPTLVTALGGASNSQLQWVVDAYVLSFAALLLTAGSAADRLGRRRVLMLGLAVFALVSVGAAFAQTPVQLITWRALMGIGAAMIFPATLAVITADFPEPALRRTAIAVWAGASGLGVAIGPVAGGWLLTHFHWGSIFFINVPLIALVLLGAAVLIRESRDSTPHPFDPAGNALAVVGVVALVWALIEGPGLGWTSAPILGVSAAAVVLLVLFVWWEARAADPMLDVTLFLNRRFAAGCLAITTAFFGLFGFVFMVTQYFQFIHGYDPLAAGIRTLPFAGFILLGSAVAAKPIPVLRPRELSAIGLVLMAVGFVWVTRDLAETPYLTLVYQMGFLGTGLGIVSAAATEAIMSSLPVSKAGVGSSVNDTAREIGGTFGVAVMGSIFNAVYRADVTASFASAPLPEEAKAAVRESVGMAIGVIARIEAEAGPFAAAFAREPIQNAFLHGFHTSSWLAGGAALAGGIAVYAAMPRPAAMFAAHENEPSPLPAPESARELACAES